MPQKRPYGAIFDNTLDIPLPQQVDDPINLSLVAAAATNRRTLAGGDSNLYDVADQAVAIRGTKSIIWSSEGYTHRGVTIPALTTAQKKATGSSATNIAGATPPAGFTLPTTLDFSPYRNLTLVINMSAISGTSIQFELDTQDDSATPVVLALWKPTAITAPAATLTEVGPGLPFAQAASAPSTAATGFGAIAAPSGWTYYSIPISFLPTGSVAWTVVSLTSISWTAWLYGSN